MGNAELDLTSARMGQGTSQIEIRCVLANVEITVPHDIRVLCDGDGMVGSFDVVRVGDTRHAADAPTLRISGTAYAGNVTVKIVGPVAPAGPGWTAKLKAGWQSLNA